MCAAVEFGGSGAWGSVRLGHVFAAVEFGSSGAWGSVHLNRVCAAVDFGMYVSHGC